MPHSIQTQVELAPRTTLGVGGRAQYFVCIKSEVELREVVLWAQSKKLPVTLLGAGSNVLVNDAGIHGLVISLQTEGITFEELSEQNQCLVEVAAGVSWDVLVETVTKRGLWGIENLSGIPGTTGAAPVQNINAYGTSLSDVLVSVRVFDAEVYEFKTLSNAECMFGYRDSIFKQSEGKRYIVLAITLRLTREGNPRLAYQSASQSIRRVLEHEGKDSPTSLDVRNAVCTVRKNIGMLPGMFRSAGSFFKNTVVSASVFQMVYARVTERHGDKALQYSPWFWELDGERVKIATAFLMECTPYNKHDFKDKKYNGVVGISPLHTLSIITVGDARAHDVQMFVETIVDAVFQECGITIEPEVIFLS